MIESSVYKRHILKLDFIQRYLKELGFTTNLIEEQNSDITNGTLVCVVGKDYKDDLRRFDFNFIPTSREIYENIELLQIVSYLKIEVNSTYKNTINKLLNAINLRMPIGNFLIDDKNKILFRHVHITSCSEILNKEEFYDIVMLCVLMLEMFTELIESTVNGNTMLSEALEDLNHM